MIVYSGCLCCMILQFATTLPLYFNVLNFCLIVYFSFQVYLYNSFNGFFVVLMFLVLTFFLIYGVELFYKVLKIQLSWAVFVCFFFFLNLEIKRE